MKIIYCDARCDLKGHFGLNATRLCQALSKKGHDVYLVTNKIYPDRYLKEKVLFKILEYREGNLKLDRFMALRERFPVYFYYGYFRNSFLVLKEALKLAQKLKVDVLHGTDIEFGIASILLKGFSKKLPPVIWEVQAANFTFNTYSGNFLERFYKSIQRRIFKMVLGREIKAFAVLGEYQRQELKKQLSLKDDFIIEVIREGGDGPIYLKDKKLARKNIIGEYNDKTIFLFFGLLRRDKGIEYLLKAISLIKSGNFILVIAGYPVHYKKGEIHKMIYDLGIENKVFLRLEYIPEDEVSDYFFACDAVIFPYTKQYTGGSGPLFNEGGACCHGKPSIVSDVSEMGRAVKKYGLGLVFEPENSYSLAATMDCFINLSQSEKEKFSNNALNFAKQNTWERRAEKYIELYIRTIEKTFAISN